MSEAVKTRLLVYAASAGLTLWLWKRKILSKELAALSILGTLSIAALTLFTDYSNRDPSRPYF